MRYLATINDVNKTHQACMCACVEKNQGRTCLFEQDGEWNFDTCYQCHELHQAIELLGAAAGVPTCPHI